MSQPETMMPAPQTEQEKWDNWWRHVSSGEAEWASSVTADFATFAEYEAYRKEHYTQEVCDAQQRRCNQAANEKGRHPG